MEFTIETLVTAIGVLGAPVLGVMVVDHLRQFARVVWSGVEFIRAGIWTSATGNAWLLVRDAVLIGAAFLIRESGGLQPVFDAGVDDNPATLILVGLALSYAAGQLYDRNLVKVTPTPTSSESVRSG